MKREPAVAGQFYPGDEKTLRQTIADLAPAPPEAKQQAIAVVSPHAGYVYSGAVAAETIGRVIIPETVIILGPNHHGAGARLAVMTAGSWQMPFGEVAIDSELAAAICESSIFTPDHLAHLQEHSLEVQVPFLQHFGPDISIVPICVSHISYDDCEKAGKALALAIKSYNRPVLIVASTDMTHYESREAASRKDHMAMEHLTALDPEGLYNTVVSNRISMCGIIPTTITLIAAKLLGAAAAELVRYTDSGETSGDTRQVVGYAGFIIS